MQNTTLCYIEENDSYLMLHRIKKENDINKDKWIGIGGKFQNGESPEECILREAKEETGLTLNNLEYRGIVTFVSDKTFTEYMHLFYCNNFSGTLIDCEEGNLEWVKKSNLNNLEHWKGDEIFLNLIEMKVPFFSLKLEYENGILIDAKLNNKKISF
jgi:8-oxo-dGTP diphosphatase